MLWIDLGINKVPQDCQKVILGILFWAGFERIPNVLDARVFFSLAIRSSQRMLSMLM